jgi:hypothetical protein
MRFFKNRKSRTKGSKSKYGNLNESPFANASVQIDNKEKVVDVVPLLPDSKLDQELSKDACEQSKGNENLNKKKLLQLRDFVRHIRIADKHRKKSQKELNDIRTLTKSSDDSSSLLFSSENFTFNKSKSIIDSFRQGSFSDYSMQASGSTLNSSDSSTNVDSGEFFEVVGWDNDNTDFDQANIGSISLISKGFEDNPTGETEDLFQKENAPLEDEENMFSEKNLSKENDFTQFGDEENIFSKNNLSKEQSYPNNTQYFEQDVLHALNELLVLENKMASQKNEEEENVKKIIEGVMSRRLQREYIVCDQSCGEISDIEPSFSDTDSIWTSISQCTTRTAKISNRNQDHSKCNNRIMKSSPGRTTKVSSHSFRRPQSEDTQECREQDAIKTQTNGSKLAADMMTIFEDIVPTKYLNLKSSSAALLLKENLAYAMQAAGFSKNDDQRFLFAPVSESNG